MVILGVLINETCYKTGRVSTRDFTVGSNMRQLTKWGLILYEIAAHYLYFHNFTKNATHTIYVRNKIFWKVFCAIVVVFNCNFKKG